MQQFPKWKNRPVQATMKCPVQARKIRWRFPFPQDTREPEGAREFAQELSSLCGRKSLELVATVVGRFAPHAGNQTAAE